jgi:hypothetical protein
MHEFYRFLDMELMFFSLWVIIGPHHKKITHKTIKRNGEKGQEVNK